MKKILTFFVAFLSFGLLIATAQTDYTVKRGERPPIDLDALPGDAFEKGILKIKIDESFTNQLDNHQVIVNENGIVSFNITSLDQLNQRYRPTGFDKLFGNESPSSKFYERHRAWGFHLWYTLYFDEKTDIKELVAAYRQLDEISIAEPLYKTELLVSERITSQTKGEEGKPEPSQTDWTPNDPSFNLQWHYHNTGQSGGTVDADIDLPEAWDIAKGNSNVIVSVHDMGVQYDHPDLNGNMWINSDEIAGNGIDDDSNGYIDDIYGYDFYNNNGSIEAGFHGAHVAGTVAAESNNGVGVSGVAGGSGSNDGVRIMTCMVYHPTIGGGIGHHLAPVYAADNGACIEQNSWGYTNPNVYDQAVLDAIDYFNINGGGTALSGGITIYAAGNSNSNGNYYPGYYSGTFAVAATNNQDIKSYYSNYGTWVDISAPGGETNVLAARGVYSTYTTSTYNYLQGTSMACPHVSGVAALIVSYAYGQLTATEVADILRNTTDNHYGVNPGYIGQLGTGRLNAYQALLETANYLGTPGLWTGTVSTAWNSGANWDDGVVPTSSTNVTIQAGTPFQPVIANGVAAYAASIFLQFGSSLTQNSTSWFYVYGTFDAGFGQFTMNGTTSYLYLGGSTNSLWWDDYQDDTYSTVVIYKDNTAATVTMQTNMNCNRLMEVFSGTLSFNNTVLTCSSALSPAFSVRSAGGKIILDSSSDGIYVTGSMLFENNSQATISNGTIRCGGNFNVNNNTSYNIGFTGGTLIMDGNSTQYITDLDGGNLDLFNLNIEKTGGTCYINSANLDINGNLTISGGALSCDNGPSPTATYNINIAGDWLNYVGAGGFIESTGRVIFDDGVFHQYCSNETFNILEVNKPSLGALRPYNGHNIVCAAYDWTAGAVDVIEGSFTANGLLDNGISGSFYCNPLGTINLNNQLGNQWVDLNGELHIYGGTVNVSGSLSDWPYAANALIEMSGGVLDFKTCGININDSPFFTLTNNITGGIIRTSQGFSSYRADFTPTAGTIELYGASDAGIYQSNGSTFWDVNINKGAKNASIGEPILPGSGERIDKTAGNGGKANSASLYSDIEITNYLTISAGTFEIGGYTCSVSRVANVYGTLSMTNPTGVFNVGTYQYDNLHFWSGSTGNLAAGNINLNSWIAVDAGSYFNASVNNTIHIIGSNFGGGLANLESTAVFGNININKTANPSYLASDYAGPYNVQGSFTVQPGNSFQSGWNSMHVNGIVTDQPTSSIYLYYAFKDANSQTIASKEDGEEELKSGAKGGGLTIDTDFTLNGLLDVADGNALVHGIFHLATTGNLNITSGSFIADGPLFAKNWEYIDGHLGLTSGLFEISNNSIQFSATGTSTVSGGIIRSGEAFAATNPGNFLPTSGTLEIVGVGTNTIYCDNGNYFYNLLINRDPSAGSTLYTNITVNNNLTVNSGTLSLNSRTASVLGGIEINNLGVLLLNGGANLLLAGGTALNVNSGGWFAVIGAIGSPGKVSRISTGYYAFNVQSGGLIIPKYGTFEYMNTNGINLLSGSLVDPGFSFNYCTFQNGQAGGRLMSVENNQVFSVENAVFPTNTWSGAYNVYKAVNAGTVNFVTATGGFAGESFDFDPNSRVNWGGRSLSLKAYLEGPFNGTNMNTTINGILPISHPFNPALPYFGNPLPDWRYTGSGSVTLIPNVNIVDWVLVELRDAVNAASATKATAVAQLPAFILNNGNIVGLDGVSNLQFSNIITNNLFVVIYQRNHISIMSATAVPYAAGVYTFDYTTGATQVYGGAPAHKLLATNKWGMRSGDGNGDCDVLLNDKTAVWAIPGQIGKTGYLPSDYNFDRHTNNKDKNDKWLPNNGSVSSVPN